MEAFSRPHMPPLQRSHTASTADSLTRPGTTKRSPLHHTHHPHHQPHLHRDNVVPQSAIATQPSSNPDWPRAQKTQSRSVGGTPDESRSQSRRDSLAAWDGENELKLANTSMEKTDKKPKEIVSKKLVKERERARLRNGELRSSLSSLSRIATITTRRLDETYYSILERIPILRSTISSLQEISLRTSTLHHDFQEDAEELVSDIKDQISSYNTSNVSQTKIEALENRILNGRAKVSELGQRLEDVRARVETWEKQEAEWQAQVSRRLRMLWGALITAGIIFSVLIGFHYSPTRVLEGDSSPATNLINGTRNTSLSDRDGTSPLAGPHLEVSRPPASTPLEDHPKLRVFDEL